MRKLTSTLVGGTVEIKKNQSLEERVRMSRKNRASRLRSNNVKYTWNKLQEEIGTYVCCGASFMVIEARKVRYTHIRPLMKLGYRVYAHPNRKGKIVIQWDDFRHETT